MRITKAGNKYRVNGLPISRAVLATIGRGVFNPAGWRRVWRELDESGAVNITFNVPYEVASDWRNDLEVANKKIAVLEKKVAELTLKNLYQVA